MRIKDIAIDPERCYDDFEWSEISGKKRSTLAADRSRGRGVPFIRIGRKPFYLGRDIIDTILRGRVSFIALVLVAAVTLVAAIGATAQAAVGAGLLP